MFSKFQPGVQAGFQKAVKSNQEVGRLLRYLISPISVAGYTLAAWRIGSDLSWTGEFFISNGLLSHWQVWLALAIGAQLGGAQLNRTAEVHGAEIRNRAIAS